MKITIVVEIPNLEPWPYTEMRYLLEAAHALKAHTSWVDAVELEREVPNEL